jgi:hypothetical protein
METTDGPGHTARVSSGPSRIGSEKRHYRYLTDGRQAPSSTQPVASRDGELQRASSYAVSALAPATRRAYEQNFTSLITLEDGGERRG